MPLDDDTLAIPGYDFEPPPADEPEPEPIAAPSEDDAQTPDPPRPINWNLLTAEEAQVEWLERNAWINWLRHTYEDPAPAVEESAITNRDEDFVQFVRDDIARRRAAEDAFYEQLAADH